METQKIVNLWNSSENENSKFATKKWCYWRWIKRCLFIRKSNPIQSGSLESSLCNYSDAYVLVTGSTAVVGANNNTEVAFKNRSPFRKRKTEINGTFIDEAHHINIAMPMYNLI